MFTSEKFAPIVTLSYLSEAIQHLSLKRKAPLDRSKAIPAKRFRRNALDGYVLEDLDWERGWWPSGHIIIIDYMMY